jgi:hypothetical protein
VLAGGRTVESRLGVFPQIRDGEEVLTEEGRAEILLSPGVFLRVAENSSFRMISTGLAEPRLEFLTGAILIEAAELARDSEITVLYRDTTVTLHRNGLYRLEASPPQLRVFDGRARVEAGGKTVEVRKGKRLVFDGSLAVLDFDRKLTDPFDRWSSRRAEYLAMANLYAAKRVLDSGLPWATSGWFWNPYLGMFTFIPYRGSYFSPYGYRFFSPSVVRAVYEPPRQRPSQAYSGFGRYDSGRGYNTIPATRSGTSGTVAASGSSSPTTSSTSSPSAPISRESGRAGGRQR